MSIQHFKLDPILQFSKALFKALTTPLIIYFTIIGNAIMFLSAYLFLCIEREVNHKVETYGDALWWALCTVSTVGYGDIYPMTHLGRVIAAFLIITGVMFYMGSFAIMITTLSVLHPATDKVVKKS